MRFIIKLKALSLSLILVTACAQSKESHNQEAAKIIKSNTTPNTNSSLTSDGKSEGVEVPSLFDESKSLNKLSNLNVCLQEAPAIQVVQNDCGVIPLKQKTDFETALLKDYISQSCFQKSPQDPNCLAIYNDWSDLKNQKAICLAKLRNCSKNDFLNVMIEKFSLAEKQLCKPIVEDAKLPSDMSFMNKKQYCDYLALSLELFLRLRVEHQASLNQ